MAFLRLRRKFLNLAITWLFSLQSYTIFSNPMEFEQELEKTFGSRTSYGWNFNAANNYYAAIPEDFREPSVLLPVSPGVYPEEIRLFGYIATITQPNEAQIDTTTHTLIFAFGNPDNLQGSLKILNKTDRSEQIILLQWNRREERVFDFSNSISGLEQFIQEVRSKGYLKRIYWEADLADTDDPVVQELLKGTDETTIKLQFLNLHRYSLRSHAYAVSYIPHETKTAAFLYVEDDQSRERFVISASSGLALHYTGNDFDTKSLCKVEGKKIFRYPNVKVPKDIIRSKWVSLHDVNLDFTRREGTPITPVYFYSVQEGNHELYKVPTTATETGDEENQVILEVLVPPQFQKDAFYEEQASPQELPSDYIVSDGRGKLFVTRAYKHIFRPLGENEDHNITSLVEMPLELSLDPATTLVSQATWLSGIFKAGQKTSGFWSWNPTESIGSPITLSNPTGSFFSSPSIESTQYSSCEALRLFNPIESITASFQEMTPRLIECLSSWTKITDLRLSGIALKRGKKSPSHNEEDALWKDIFISVSRLNNLRSLDLSRNNFGSWQFFDQLENALDQLNALTTLRIQEQGFLWDLDKARRFYDAIIRHINSLQELHVDPIMSYTCCGTWQLYEPVNIPTASPATNIFLSILYYPAMTLAWPFVAAGTGIASPVQEGNLTSMQQTVAQLVVGKQSLQKVEIYYPRHPDEDSSGTVHVQKFRLQANAFIGMLQQAAPLLAISLNHYARV